MVAFLIATSTHSKTGLPILPVGLSNNVTQSVYYF